MPLDIIVTADGEIIVPSIDYGRYCVRCGVSIHTTDPSHLCRDVQMGLRDQIEADFREYARELVVYGGEA